MIADWISISDRCFAVFMALSGGRFSRLVSVSTGISSGISQHQVYFTVLISLSGGR